MNQPLANKMRPEKIEDVIGQKHILGENSPLYKIIKSGKATNMIFYGPPGTGKTTVANIIAENIGMQFFKVNATTAAGKDIKDILEQSNTVFGSDGMLLYLDEIQYLNKKQQQTLMEYIENGKVTLIASTTENPYFYIYKAVLSRCAVFEFKPLYKDDIKIALLRGLARMNEESAGSKEISEEALDYIAETTGGDVRSSLNALELSYFIAEKTITLDDARSVTNKGYINYDKSGDDKYELMSALQKSIRGSDENAAVFYLAKLLACGDLIAACRRLLVIASEDIGLAYPQAIAITKACVDSAIQLGLPEARIPLAEAAVLLATAPKSNSSYVAVNSALSDIEAGLGSDMPSHLKNNHFMGVGDSKNAYIYPHDYPDHYVKQQYLPDDIKDKIYYKFGENKTEQLAKQYMERIKGVKE